MSVAGIVTFRVDSLAKSVSSDTIQCRKPGYCICGAVVVWIEGMECRLQIQLQHVEWRLLFEESLG